MNFGFRPHRHREEQLKIKEAPNWGFFLSLTKGIYLP